MDPNQPSPETAGELASILAYIRRKATDSEFERVAIAMTALADEIERGVHRTPALTYEQFRHSFHHLWTQTVGAPRYEKKWWLSLSRQVDSRPDPKRWPAILADAAELSRSQGAAGTPLDLTRERG